MILITHDHSMNISTKESETRTSTNERDQCNMFFQLYFIYFKMDLLG